MPNWVTCRVISTDMKKLKELMCQGDSVDFNKLIPMPQDLLDVQKSSYSYNKETLPMFSDKYLTPVIPVMMSIYYDVNVNTQKDFLDKALNNKELVQSVKNYFEMDGDSDFYKDSIESFFKGFYNYGKYGYVDWYDWSRANWGVKWNASNGYWDGDNYGAGFETAWVLPYEYLMKLAEQVDLRVLYADEDRGVNCGVLQFTKDDDGNVMCETLMEESDELAYFAWCEEYIPVYDDDWNELPPTNERVIEANKNFSRIADEISAIMNVDNFKKEMAGV